MYKQIFILLVLINFCKALPAQKGTFSISAGPFVSIPLSTYGNGALRLTTGGGLQAIGQYNFSERSAVIVQTGLTFESVSYGLDTSKSHRTIFFLKGGYQYQFGSSGIFANILIGTENHSNNEASFTSTTLGAGKRFTVAAVHFIDVGIDFINTVADSRLYLKAVFSILQRPKK